MTLHDLVSEAQEEYSDLVGIEIKNMGSAYLEFISAAMEKAYEAGERSGREKTVEFIKGSFDGRRLFKVKTGNYEVQQGLMKEILDLARIPAPEAPKEERHNAIPS